MAWQEQRPRSGPRHWQAGNQTGLRTGQAHKSRGAGNPRASLTSPTALQGRCSPLFPGQEASISKWQSRGVSPVWLVHHPATVHMHMCVSA